LKPEGLSSTAAALSVVTAASAEEQPAVFPLPQAPVAEAAAFGTNALRAEAGGVDAAFVAQHRLRAVLSGALSAAT